MSALSTADLIDARPASSPWDEPSARPSGSLERLVRAARAAMTSPAPWSMVADRVADALRDHLPAPSDLLTLDQQAGEPGPLRSHLLHAEADGALSIVALVTRPGQSTPIHDHVTWCVSAVLQGVEHEELFRLDEDAQTLVCCGTIDSAPGEVTGFAPPGDIHRVSNRTDDVAISILIYGTDISRVGSSVRRIYDLPIIPV